MDITPLVARFFILGFGIFPLKMLSTGVLVWGDVLSNASPVINTMHDSPAAKGCGNEGV